jgi:hypothetical protein
VADESRYKLMWITIMSTKSMKSELINNKKYKKEMKHIIISNRNQTRMVCARLYPDHPWSGSYLKRFITKLENMDYTK